MKNILFIFLIICGTQMSAQDSFLGFYSGLSNSTIQGENYVSNPQSGIYYTGGFNYSLVWKSGFFVGTDLLYEQKGFSTDGSQIVNGEQFENGLKWNFDYVGAALKIGYVHEIKRKHRVYANAIGQFNSILSSNVEVMKIDNTGNLTSTRIANLGNTKKEDILVGYGIGYSTSLADRIAGSIELRWMGSVVSHHVPTFPLRQGYHTAYQILIGFKFPLEAKNLCNTCP